MKKIGFIWFLTALTLLIPILSSADEITLQPDYILGKDSYIRQSDPGRNCGSESTLFVYNDESQKGIMRTFIEFEFSKIPSNSTINKATLSLWVYTLQGNTNQYIRVYRNASSWDENTITWNNYPPFYSGMYVDTKPPSSTGVWFDIDITQIVQSWINGSFSNYGMVLQWVNETEYIWRHIEFVSSDYSSDSSKHPKLYINYTPPGGNKPGAFNLLTPTNNSSQPPGNVHFSWEPSSNADYYHMIVDDNSDFSSPVLDIPNITGTFYDYAFPKQGKYYWKVIAHNNYGDTPCNSTFAFTIANTSPPGDFSLKTPGDKSSINPGNIYFSWETSTDADYYRIVVDDNSDFSSPVLDKDGVTSTFYEYTINKNGLYYWKVRAHNSYGDKWCRSVFTFNIADNSPPGSFNLTQPENNSSQPPGNTRFEWEKSSNATYYRIICDDNSDFSSPVFDKNVYLENYEYNLTNPVKYYWKVQARNDYGQQWCNNNFNFTISNNSPPGSFALRKPDNNSKFDKPGNIHFEWEKSSGATKYHIYIDDESGFDPKYYVHDEETKNTTFDYYLNYSDKPYYWCVWAENVNGKKRSTPDYFTFEIKQTGNFDFNIKQIYFSSMATKENFEGYPVPGAGDNVIGAIIEKKSTKPYSKCIVKFFDMTNDPNNPIGEYEIRNSEWYEKRKNINNPTAFAYIGLNKKTQIIKDHIIKVEIYIDGKSINNSRESKLSLGYLYKNNKDFKLPIDTFWQFENPPFSYEDYLYFSEYFLKDLLPYLISFNIPTDAFMAAMLFAGAFMSIDIAHCYGMSNCVMDYFENSWKLPGGKNVGDLFYEGDIRGRINFLHYCQLPSCIKHMYITSFDKVDTKNDYNLIKDNINKNIPTTVLISKTKEYSSPKHALLAYKYVELDNLKLVYVYDSNFYKEDIIHTYYKFPLIELLCFDTINNTCYWLCDTPYINDYCDNPNPNNYYPFGFPYSDYNSLGWRPIYQTTIDPIFEFFDFKYYDYKSFFYWYEKLSEYLNKEKKHEEQTGLINFTNNDKNNINENEIHMLLNKTHNENLKSNKENTMNEKSSSNDNKQLIITSCGYGNFYVQDENGSRSGIINGQEISEIPDTSIYQNENMKSELVVCAPQGKINIICNGNSQGTIDIDIFKPILFDRGHLVIFQDLDVDAGTTYTTSFDFNSMDFNMIKDSGKEYAPTYNVVYGEPETGGEGVSLSNSYFYPNPYNPSISVGALRFSPSSDCNVEIEIFDASGNKVITLANNLSVMNDKVSEVCWDGRNASGDDVANGVYFYSIKTSTGETGFGKIAIVR